MTVGRTPTDHLDLADWRRRVGDLYRMDGDGVLSRFRAGRDDLFRTHPQSPIPAADRDAFDGLRYFPANDGCRVRCRLEPHPDEDELVIDTGGEDGEIRYRRAGRLHFRLHGTECGLTVFAMTTYGGGLFLPFRDQTSGSETYGGGRYLFDTVKGTDGLALVLEGGDRLQIDFNYAYNPSCAYDSRWACPLAPPENRLPVAVRAGEKAYHDG